MADDPDPPRKYYGLKRKDFERVNDVPAPPAESLAPPPAPPDPAPPGRIDVHDLARTATAGTPLLSGNAPANRPNDIHAILQENLQRANAAGLNDVTPPPKRRSRRLRDYFIVFIPVNAFFGWWAFGPYANAMTFIYGIAGMILFSVGFSWVMFFIVDDY